jgi:deoxycytidine triphosphate deaminase
MLKHIFQSAKTALSNVLGTDVTPNALDLRVAKVMRINSNAFMLSEDEKQHRGSIEEKVDESGWWVLQPGSYEIVMENIVTVADGEAGIVIPRSTLNRNGVFITTGLYDSGYQGAMAACMHVTSGTFFLKKGTRVAQYLILASEQAGVYNGSYGLGKDHDKKYEVK